MGCYPNFFGSCTDNGSSKTGSWYKVPQYLNFGRGNHKMGMIKTEMANRTAFKLLSILTDNNAKCNSHQLQQPANIDHNTSMFGCKIL